MRESHILGWCATDAGSAVIVPFCPQKVIVTRAQCPIVSTLGTLRGHATRRNTCWTKFIRRGFRGTELPIANIKDQPREADSLGSRQDRHGRVFFTEAVHGRLPG